MSDVDPATGEVKEPDACPHCAEAREYVYQAETDLRAAEKELRNLRRQVTKLSNELQKQRTESPEGITARGLFRYWVVRCERHPERTKFGEARQKAVIGQLKLHDPQYIARAIDGLAASTWHRENGKDDLELICRNEVKLEGFYELAERIKAPTLLGPAWLKEFGVQIPEEESDVPF